MHFVYYKGEDIPLMIASYDSTFSNETLLEFIKETKKVFEKEKK
jgi:hypothetical protein